jgi:hypothetical protein
MYSVIVSINDRDKFNSVLLPSLERYSNLDIIQVEGKESLTKNYNEGMRRAKYKTKFFIHEDVDICDMIEVPLLTRIDNLLTSDLSIGLVGLVGTTEDVKSFWWEGKRSCIKGQVYIGGEFGMYLFWDKDKAVYDDIYYIDGMFMATNKDILFSEDITGFHLYDLDYCNVIRSRDYKIKVLSHIVRHMSHVKDISNVNFEYYQSKWFKKEIV